MALSQCRGEIPFSRKGRAVVGHFLMNHLKIHFTRKYFFGIMRFMTIRTPLIHVFLLALLFAVPVRAAHFDIDAGRVVLRQLQYCTHCGSALLVTNVHAGTLVRCPDCGHEQARLDNQYILNQMYQLCKTCGGPLNPEGHKPGDLVDCENCRTRQALDRDAFALAKKKNGPGYAPGHPPGTGKKNLLLAPPRRDDGPVPMPPLPTFEYGDSDIPLPAHLARAGEVPAPPEAFRREQRERQRERGEREARESRAAASALEAVEMWEEDLDSDFDVDVQTLVITEQVRKRPEPAADPLSDRPHPTPSLRPPMQPTQSAQPIQSQQPPQPRRPVREFPPEQAPPPERQRPKQPEPPPPSERPRRPPIQTLRPEPAAQAGAGVGGSDSGAIEVPAVTADLFGGKRFEPAARRTENFAPPGDVLARVNGEPIHRRDVDRVVEPIMERLRAAAGPDDGQLLAQREKDLRREALERLIDRELVVREAAAMGYVPDPSAIRERENELAQIVTVPGGNLRREAMRDITMRDMRKQFDKPGSAPPTAVREFYQKHKERLVQPRRIAVDQLVVYEDRTDRADRRDFREIAVEIAGVLEQGARFDEVRERYDEFAPAAGIPHSAPVLLPEAAYSRQILAAAGELRRGAVFGPLFLSGMALFGKVADERKEGPVPFEEVEKEIRRQLEEEATEKRLTDWLKRLRSKARIEILP